MQTNDSQKGSPNTPQSSKPSGLSWSQPASTTTQPQTKPSVAQASSSKGSTSPKVPQGATTPNRRRLLGFIASGLLLGFIVGWAWYAFRPSADELATTNTATTTSTGTVITGGGSTSPTAGTGSAGSSASAPSLPATGVQVALTDTVSAPNPQSPGTKVLLSAIDVSVPTWVVVYDNKNGVRGNALGAALFTPTSAKGAVYLTLLRATTAGQTYLIGRNVDNGDQIFSLQTDGPVVDTTGAPIYQTLEVR